MPPLIPKVEAEGVAPAGSMAAAPMPMPRVVKKTMSAAAMTEPAMMAPQDTRRTAPGDAP